MDRVLPDCTRYVTPAKQKAEFSAVADEDDSRWKKLKEETLAHFMEDDLPCDVKSEEDLLGKAEETPSKLKDEVSPAANEDDFLSNKLNAEETSAAMEADLLSDVKSEDKLLAPENLEDAPEDEEKPPPAIEISKEEGWVDEIPDVPNPNRYTILKFDFDEEDYDFANEEERINLKLYFQEFSRSEGFDIEHFSDKVMNGLVPMDLDEEDKYLVTRDCRKAIVAAIKYKNLVYGWNLELVKLIKCNIVTGSFYYATFDAKDGDEVIRTYQAQLARDHFTPKTTIFMFRVKPDPSAEPK